MSVQSADWIGPIAVPSAVLILLISATVIAQKDDVEWLFPPGTANSNDVFNQAFGPPDFFGGPGLQGPPGIGIGGGGQGYKVRDRQ